MTITTDPRNVLRTGTRVLYRAANRFTGKIMSTVVDRAVSRIDPMR